MRRAELHYTRSPERPIPDSAVLAVDGVLDAVGAYDLRRCVEEALHAQVRELVLDLTHVAEVDPDGLDVLEWCVRRLDEAHVTLSCAACSRPARVALRGTGSAWPLAG